MKLKYYEFDIVLYMLPESKKPKYCEAEYKEKEGRE